jgi:AcrR family transcriptional regulator
VHEITGAVDVAERTFFRYFASKEDLALAFVKDGTAAFAEALSSRPRKLQHLVHARNARCTAPGCGRPAARCDLDHTTPWHHGGPTCPCNLAPLCRHHHRCKQAEGWWLEQPEPGLLVWRTPAGRTYATMPTEYPV